MNGVVVFELGGRLVALDAASVVKVVEANRIFFLPGQRRFIKGVISVNGEAVPVIDAGEALSVEAAPGPPRRVIVVKGERGVVYGLSIGGGRVYFRWEGEGVSPKPERIDWTRYFDEAARLLASRG